MPTRSFKMPTLHSHSTFSDAIDLMTIQSVFLAIAVSVTLISGPASAQSSPQAVIAGEVLQASEIDSSKVEVGAYVEVIYYKGEKLSTASGYIKAIESKTLTIGRGLWKEQIVFERIQKLIAKADAAPDTVQTSHVDKSNVDLYFGESLLGFLGGHVVGWSGFVCVALTTQTLSLDSFIIGSMFGVAGGVYLPQRSKRFKSFVGALSGSVLAGSLYWKLLGEDLAKKDLILVVPVQVLGSIVGEWGGRKLRSIRSKNKRDYRKQDIAVSPLFIHKNTGSVFGIAFNF